MNEQYIFDVELKKAKILQHKKWQFVQQHACFCDCEEARFYSDILPKYGLVAL